MACTHPFGIERIKNAEGETIGVICPSCGRTARKGDPVWPLNVMLVFYALVVLGLVGFMVAVLIGVA
jgi:hypothetical protein